MNSENLKIIIGNNIAVYRKRAGMTQADLAQKLNFTDKAVSKWERGDSVPDVATLVALAELFDITVNDLLVESEILPLEPVPEKRRANKCVIQILVSLLVWFVALLTYVVLDSIGVTRSWLGFFYAVPVNALVLLCLRSAWRKYNLNHLLISVMVWGTLISLYFSMLIFTKHNLWKMFLLGFLGQAAVTAWFFLKEKKHG